MHYRDFLQRVIYNVINPIVKGMIRVGITPNMITTIGLLGNVAAAVLLLYGGVECPGDLSYVGWGGAIILFSGLFDMMDGRVARLSGQSSVFGALYDSVLDRYSELITLFGISYWLILSGYLWGSVLTFLALMGSLMVSYVRARAEGLDIECKVGLMQRPERVVVTAVACILAGVLQGKDFDSTLIVVGAMALIALLANLTAVWRILHCRKQLK
ncbi:MAG: CDP-alcohol phosphatidyltransferase family protein [Bacteroidaceae bacterium]|nr:CDP-alcohol phosphatidyltransferase family protein [Bacteroidaceae bacterium]